MRDIWVYLRERVELGFAVLFGISIICLIPPYNRLLKKERARRPRPYGGGTIGRSVDDRDREGGFTIALTIRSLDRSYRAGLAMGLLSHSLSARLIDRDLDSKEAAD